MTSRGAYGRYGFYDLRVFQAEHKVWLDHNFPNQTAHQALLGVIEEVGELAHAHLKYEQSIRKLDRDEYERQANDAIGDIIIYLASYCNTNLLSLARSVEKAWEEVYARDWIKYPDTGRPPVTAGDLEAASSSPEDSRLPGLGSDGDGQGEETEEHKGDGS